MNAARKLAPPDLPAWTLRFRSEIYQAQPNAWRLASSRPGLAALVRSARSDACSTAMAGTIGAIAAK